VIADNKNNNKRDDYVMCEEEEYITLSLSWGVWASGHAQSSRNTLIRLAEDWRSANSVQPVAAPKVSLLFILLEFYVLLAWAGCFWLSSLLKGYARVLNDPVSRLWPLDFSLSSLRGFQVGRKAILDFLRWNTPK